MFAKYVEKAQEVEAFRIVTLEDAIALIKQARSCHAELKVDAGGLGDDFTLILFHDQTGREWRIHRGEYFICARNGAWDTNPGDFPRVMPPIEFNSKWVEA